MKTNRFIMCISVLLLAGLCSIAVAQRPGGGPGRPHGGPPAGGPQNGPPDGPRPPRPRLDGAFDFASIEMLGGGRVVKGIPYSADAVSESTQMLRDGTSLSHTSTTSVARDGEGRLRRERTLDTIGPFKTADGPQTLIVIDDPILGSHFVFDVENKTARKIRNPEPPRGEGPPQGPPRGGMDERRGEFADGKVESLGTKSIEGVEAEGTRSTITIPVGKIGNDRAIEIISERWYSPTLQVVMLSKHSDPRMGDTVYRLTNIKRVEPDASLFKVPADYKIVEGEGPPPRRPGGPGGPGERGGGPGGHRGPGGPGAPGGPGSGPGMPPMGPPPGGGRAPGRPNF